jgi:hypothetical protein
MLRMIMEVEEVQGVEFQDTYANIPTVLAEQVELKDIQTKVVDHDYYRGKHHVERPMEQEQE